jgi:hypothetical protein
MRHLCGQKDSRVRIVFLIPLLLLAATPALAQSACVEPVMPTPVKGAATAAQMRAAMADAHTFIAESSVYQDCLLKEVDAAKTQAAAASQSFEPMIETSARYKVEASKRAQERVGATANRALTAYKNASIN